MVISKNRKKIIKEIKKIFLPMQAGDVKKTWANNESRKWINFCPVLQ